MSTRKPRIAIGTGAVPTLVLRRDAPALARPRGVWLRIETMEVLLCVHYGEEHIGPELNGWRVAICSAGGPNAVQ